MARRHKDGDSGQDKLQRRSHSGPVVDAGTSRHLDASTTPRIAAISSVDGTATDGVGATTYGVASTTVPVDAWTTSSSPWITGDVPCLVLCKY